MNNIATCELIFYQGIFHTGRFISFFLPTGKTYSIRFRRFLKETFIYLFLQSHFPMGAICTSLYDEYSYFLYIYLVSFLNLWFLIIYFIKCPCFLIIVKECTFSLCFKTINILETVILSY